MRERTECCDISRWEPWNNADERLYTQSAPSVIRCFQRDYSTQWTPPGLTQTATHETLQSASTDTANMFHPHWWESALISDLWSVLKVMSEPRVSQPISPSILSAGELQHVQDPAQCMLPQVIQRGQYSWPCMACTEDWDCHQDLLHVVILVILQLLSHLQQFRNIDGTEIILYGILSKLN